MSDNFFPSNFKIEDAKSHYVKLVEGQNRFRIISKPIVGNEYWNEVDGKRTPVRVKLDEKIDISKVDDPSTIKQFAAFVIYDYQAKEVKIWEITQKTLLRTIKGLSADADWGFPTGYDLVINRSGKGLETEYTVTPKPKSELDPAIVKYAGDLNIDLNKLFTNEDPFQGTVITEE